MALTILDDSMSSDRSTHTARRAPSNGLHWEVSWLPGRAMDRNSAITAMIFTDVTAAGGVDPSHQFWPQLENWAAELDLTATDALTRTAQVPAWNGLEKQAEPADPEAAG
jgi:hypothetical protein